MANQYTPANPRARPCRLRCIDSVRPGSEKIALFRVDGSEVTNAASRNWLSAPIADHRQTREWTRARTSSTHSRLAFDVVGGCQSRAIPSARPDVRLTNYCMARRRHPGLDRPSREFVIARSAGHPGPAITRVTIAHRKSTIESADRVLCIRENRVQEITFVETGHVASTAPTNAVFEATES